MLRELDNFYLTQEEPNRSCFLALREIILSFDREITPEWKYKLPFFYYKNKMFCYLWKDKKTQEPYIGIVRSEGINHSQLEKGNRKKMKIYRINPNEDIDVEELYSILKQAKSKY